MAIDEPSFLVIVTFAALAGVTVAVLERRIALPVVVLEVMLGILIGPQVLGFAQVDDFTNFFANLGLGMLFFFAGYEIDFDRIKGDPLKLAVVGWLMSLALAYMLAGVLEATGLVLSWLYVGSAIATTAIGTLIPILRDGGDLRTRFGTYLLAAGALGEFGPILLITLVLSSGQPAHEAVILIAFVALAVGVALLTVRTAWKGWPVLERTLESSSQLAVRLAVVLVFGLVALASNLGLDLLLGGFAAGIITRSALRGQEVALFESKLMAVGYGFLIPFFFISSGMKFDLDALLASTKALIGLPLLLGFFLIVRGLPAMVLYRNQLPKRERTALAFYCATELPLVVAITTIAVDGGDMRASTAASLVGAAMLSTLIFPLVARRLRSGATEDLAPAAGVA